jgi:hypothetical protein
MHAEILHLKKQNLELEQDNLQMKKAIRELTARLGEKEQAKEHSDLKRLEKQILMFEKKI